MQEIDEEFLEVGVVTERRIEKIESQFKKSKKWILHYGRALWDTSTLLIGIAGPIVLAYSVQSNPQRLSLVMQEDRDVHGVYDLVYRISTSTNQSVFAVVDDHLFQIGVTLIALAFILQFLSIWGRDILSIMDDLYRKLSRSW